ncbi:MAG: FlgD immunoglobulin-like domain containing protein, partial [bacterium]
WLDKSNNELGFKIERKTTGAYSQITTVGANTTIYKDTGLSANTTYYYRIRAYNTLGDSSYSNEANATTQSGGGGGGGGCMNPEIGLELSKKEAMLLENLKEKLAISDSSIANLYFQFEGEIMALLRINPNLRKQTKGLIQHFGEDLEGFASSKEGGLLDQADIEAFNSWLSELAKYASPGLKKEVAYVKNMVGNAKTIDEVLLNQDFLDIDTPEEKEPTQPEAPVVFQTRLLSISSSLNSYCFSFELAENLEVNIEIYNIIGQQVKGLNLGLLGSGRHKIYWDKTNNSGQRISKGLYFARFQAGKTIQTQSLIVK